MLDVANKAYSFQIVGQIGSQMTPEDRRIVKGLGRLYASFVYKEDEREEKTKSIVWVYQ